MRMPSSTAKVARAVWEGARTGLILGASLAALMGVRDLLPGQIGDRPTPFYRWVLYGSLSGVLAGSIAGLLKPLTRGRFGAAFVGVLAFLPIPLLHHQLINESFVVWDRPVILACGVISIVLGAIGGLVLRSANNTVEKYLSDSARK